MSLSQKDFIAIAQALHARDPRRTADNDSGMLLQWKYDCSAVADVLAETNPRFEHSKFLKACGAAD